VSRCLDANRTHHASRRCAAGVGVLIRIRWTRQRRSVPAWLHGFVPSCLSGFVASWLRGFVASWLRGSVASCLCACVPSCLLPIPVTADAIGGFMVNKRQPARQRIRRPRCACVGSWPRACMRGDDGRRSAIVRDTREQTKTRHPLDRAPAKHAIRLTALQLLIIKLIIETIAARRRLGSIPARSPAPRSIRWGAVRVHIATRALHTGHFALMRGGRWGSDSHSMDAAAPSRACVASWLRAGNPSP
jgi:hypothetical protein